HALERGARQVDLAAHFDTFRRAAPEGERNRADGANVRGHFFAASAVAAGRALHQPSVLVGEGDAEAVDFHFSHVSHGRLAEAGAFSHAFVKPPQLFVVVGVVEAEHWNDMFHRLETFDGPAGAALRG